MALLMQNEFSKIVETFTVVDCRFPYEFAGGHIQVVLTPPLSYR